MQLQINQFQKEVKEHGSYAFPFTISNERLSLYENGSFLWHWHPEIELTLITEGEILYQVNQNTFHLKAGDAFFCNANVVHSGSMLNQIDCKYISITFDPKLLYGFENSLLYNKYIIPIIFDVSFPCVSFSLSIPWQQDIIEIIKSILLLFDKKKNGFEIQLLKQLYDFWLILLDKKESLPIFSYDSEKNYERIRIILSYIAQHYSEKITLDDISAQVFLCKSECCRLFKKYMKLPLFEYILQYRIEQSLGYLSSYDYTITTIAEKTGFCDSNYYSKTFLKRMGCTPKAYRKKLLP